MTTLVVGSSGLVGSWVVLGLMNKGKRVRCMSRSVQTIGNLPDTVEGIVADLDHPHTLRDAFKGIDSVFLLVSAGSSETEQGLHAVSAAKSAGVRKIVYLSVARAPGSDVIPHFRSKIPIEDAIRESGIQFTVLRPNDFFQNDVSVIGVVIGYGVYPTPLGSVGVSRVDARDIADAAVNSLTEPGHEGRTYSLHGPVALTGMETAKIYSRYAGKNVRYAGDDIESWAQHYRNVIPDWRSRNMRTMFRYYQEHGLIAPEADLEKEQLIIGHKPRSFEAFARQLTDEWKRSLACAA